MLQQPLLETGLPTKAPPGLPQLSRGILGHLRTGDLDTTKLAKLLSCAPRRLPFALYWLRHRGLIIDVGRVKGPYGGTSGKPLIWHLVAR